MPNNKLDKLLKDVFEKNRLENKNTPEVLGQALQHTQKPTEISDYIFNYLTGSIQGKFRQYPIWRQSTLIDIIETTIPHINGFNLTFLCFFVIENIQSHNPHIRKKITSLGNTLHFRFTGILNITSIYPYKKINKMNLFDDPAELLKIYTYLTEVLLEIAENIESDEDLAAEFISDLKPSIYKSIQIFLWNIDKDLIKPHIDKLVQKDCIPSPYF